MGETLLAAAPRLTAAAAARIAHDHFAVDGVATPLPSERDQNWLVDAPAGSGVLKIANALETPALIAAQQEALAHIGRGPSSAATLVPCVIPAADGRATVEIRHGDATHLCWMITELDGVPLASARRRSPGLLRSIGAASGSLAAALDGFDHPAVHRDFHWDLVHAPRVIGERLSLVRDTSLRESIERVVAATNLLAALLDALPRRVIHGDLNDHNILVGGGSDAESRNQQVTGIVDFGDMVHSYAVADLAIAVAYLMAGSDDPLVDAAHVVGGRHAVRPLGESEISAVFPLALLRLCMSACVAAEQTRANPDNPYLDVSQRSIARSLSSLARTPFALAEAVFRHACGLEPSPNHARIVHWLRERESVIAPVMGVDLRREPSLVLDWSIASPMLGADDATNAEPAITDRVFDAMRAAGAGVAIGRYDEPRLLYVSPAFAAATSRITDERRTVHIGLDLFAEAGAPVFAPLDGTVHAFADNDAPCDYGPVIILEHAIGDGTSFFTLYGHLARESLDGLVVGQSVKAGERIAWLGAPAVNGGWTPHLHLQIITDLMGLGTDYPGVARPSQRAAWLSLCPDPNLLAGVPADRFPQVTPSKSSTLGARRRLFGRNLSLAYRDPLRIVRGWMQYLFDDEGRRYVDAYNNVPHVGHCHPRVVDAIATQSRVLNTNTRYLSDVVNAYAERLTALFPPPLDVCFLVSSASEANELAIRLARAHTGARETIVLEGAYHGNTTTLIDVSPYKHSGPGGWGAPDWVHVAPLPDDYRGPYRRGDPGAGAKYAAHVSTIVGRLRAEGCRLSAFIAESCPSVGGQIVPPRGYLDAVYRSVRAAGGVCIADEVQTGLGRIGTHLWAFEAQHVVPDIVVLGKPLGNGHPLAAVVTTRAIADSFDNGMEYFSTFGGSTVSCAAGLAVLDVMRDEGLQAHAREIGERLLAGLRGLADRHEVVGDVRGSGLFLGVELVRERSTRDPAGAEASFVVNRMRERGILAGTDGPYHNVVKIRPPMPFATGDADLLVEELERALSLLP